MRGEPHQPRKDRRRRRRDPRRGVLAFPQQERAVLCDARGRTLPFVDRVVFDAEAKTRWRHRDALLEIFRVLADEPKTRETLEIVAFKCEYVDEFS
jgi:hypothetical protein